MMPVSAIRDNVATSVAILITYLLASSRTKHQINERVNFTLAQAAAAAELKHNDEVDEIKAFFLQNIFSMLNKLCK